MNPRLWALLVAAGCASPGARTVCDKGGVLAEDGRCYDIIDDTALIHGGADGGDGSEPEGSSLPQFEGDALSAAWDGPALRAALEAASAEGLPTPFGLTAAYLEVMAEGDLAGCPGDAYELNGRYLRGCTAPSGAFYSGVSTWVPIHRPEAHEYGVNGDFMLFDRDGRRLEVGGGVGWVATGPDAPQLNFILHVTAIWEGDAGPFRELLSAALDGTLTRGAAGDSLELRGSIGFSGYAFSFRRLLLAETCAGASGALELRDPGLGWHRLDFGSGCAPCADWSFEGVEMGEVCVDLSPLMRPYADSWSHL